MDRDDIFQESGDRLPIALPSGTLLRDQFRIGRVLGAGGFGVTYLGFDELLERPVAVKEYFPRHLAVDRTEENNVEPRSSAQDKDFDFGLQRFLQEARTLAKFEDHPNIVRVRTFFGENGTGYLVMNYYEGFTLEEYIESQSGWLPEDEAMFIIHDVLDGLEAAHDAGVLHRDIDPSNIYLNGDGRVVLLDFGAARTAVGERTQTLSVMLKRGYAPHEQYHSRGEQGPWTDIYACAATLYRTLTGYKPPEAPARVMNEDLVPPIEISPSLSQQINDAVVTGLEVLPQNRPQSIQAFRDLLPEPPGIQAAAWIEGNYSPHDHDLGTADQGDAVVDVSADADCRLYVNGKVSEILEAGETVSLNLSRGSHRLRAVRTDRAAASGGTATLTTTATTTASADSDYVSLRDLIWQSEVSANPESPTAVYVRFNDDGDQPQSVAAEAETDTDHPPASTSPQPPTGDTETIRAGEEEPPDASNPDSADTDAPRGDAIPLDDVESAEGAQLSSSASTDSDSGESAPGDSTPNDSTPSNSTPADPASRDMSGSGVVSSGSRSPASAASDDDSAQSDIAVAVHHASKAAKKAGRQVVQGASTAFRRTRDATTSTAQSLAQKVREADLPAFLSTKPAEPVSRNGTEVQSGTTRPDAGAASGQRAPSAEEPTDGSTTDEPGTPVPGSALQIGGAAVLVLILIVGGWWAFFSGGAPAQPANQPPVTGDDLATTQSSVVTINVTRNDSDPEGRSVRLASVVALPGSIGAVSQLDSARIQFRPAEGFAGVATIQHTVMDADSNFADGVARVHVPFRTEPTRVFTAPRDPQMLAPADLTGDGTLDLLTATYAGRRILAFAADRADPVEVMGGAEGAIDASAADMDGDGDTDVLAAAFRDDAVYVIQNVSTGDGALSFAEPMALPGEVEGALLAQPADVNGDGQTDVIAASRIQGQILWFENQSASGGFTFSEPKTIATDFGGLEAVIVVDVDGDGDPDVVSGDYRNDVVAWHENTGDGSFTSHTVDAAATDVITVAAADVDGDGRRDLLASTASDDRVMWYPQAARDSADTGPVRFGDPQLISSDVDDPESIAVADVDQDGDADVLSASFRSGVVAWHENLGDRTFGAQHVITRDAPEAMAVLPVDLDSDGDIDIAIASQGNDQIAWFENHIDRPEATRASASADSTQASSSSSDAGA